MATSTQVSLETYLSTVYEPDVDYIDGELEDRNVGHYDHSCVQQEIWLWFHLHAKEWRIRSVIEQQTRVAGTKVRVPDVSVFPRSTPIEQVFTRPQLIAIEVLSPEDRRSRIDGKIRNYMDFGVPNIWVVDPRSREGWNCSDGNWIRMDLLALPNSPVYLSLPQLFQKLDDDAADTE